MARLTKAAMALRARLPELTQKQIADLLGVTQQSVSLWLRGARPNADLMAKIEDVLGVPMRDWTIPADESGEHPAITAKSGTEG